jgi:hypothetical protein
MKKSFYLLLFILAGIVAQNNFAEDISEDEKYYNEYPKHGVDLRMSFWDQSSGGAAVNLKGLSIDVGNGGVSGNITYNFYSNPELAFTFSIGVMASSVNVEIFSSYTSTVAPVMMGIKYYFLGLDSNNALRPYLAGSFGVVFGSESGVKDLSVGTRTETTIGGYAGFGTDIILGSLVKLHAGIGYNLFSDFSREIGGKENYSGAEISFGIGFVF